MANPQKENGFTPIAHEVLEELVKARLLGAELSMALFVIRKTWGYQKKQDIISFSQFQKGLGISRMTISKTIKNLVARKILVKTAILGEKTSFSFNKDYEKWVVNTPLLVKHKWVSSKAGYTKTSKAGYTHNRKKDNTKERAEQSSEINTLIKSFEIINPASKKFYGIPPQRKACQMLIDIYSFERVKRVIELTLPRTNGLQFFPTITTPLQLQDKWATLESAVKRYQAEKLSTKDKYKVAF